MAWQRLGLQAGSGLGIELSLGLGLGRGLSTSFESATAVTRGPTFGPRHARNV